MGGIVLPAVLALASSVVAALLLPRLPPRAATWALTALAAGSALAVTWALGALALGYAAEQPALAEALGWCGMLLTSHDRVPAAAGSAAWILLVAMLLGAGSHIMRRHRARTTNGPELLDTEVPIAFAAPGRYGREGGVVVSTGMLEILDHDERKVLFAHEQAHLKYRHHRFLQVAETAAAAVPLLRPISRRVRFATERWADEAAADELGDRRVVARAIARAALASTDARPAAVMAFGGSSTLARVEAMLQRPGEARASTVLWTSAAVAALWASVGGSTVQLHHFLQFLTHVCPL